jgi:hypothetical protein
MSPSDDFVPVVTRLPAAIAAEAEAIAKAAAEMQRVERERAAKESDADRLRRESE